MGGGEWLKVEGPGVMDLLHEVLAIDLA